MDAETSTAHPRKHLVPSRRLGRGSRSERKPDLTRGRGEGNGLRVHGVVFALLALAVLVGAIVAIAYASATMM